jgi:hypothetical protein
MHEFTNRVVELEELLGIEGDLLVEELHEAGKWGRGSSSSTASSSVGSTPPVRHLRTWPGHWRRMVASGGQLAVGELCAELGCSHEHMLHLLNEQIGVAPKGLCPHPALSSRSPVLENAPTCGGPPARRTWIRSRATLGRQRNF